MYKGGAVLAYVENKGDGIPGENGTYGLTFGLFLMGDMAVWPFFVGRDCDGRPDSDDLVAGRWRKG